MCPFCTDKDVRERVVIENDLAFAFLTQSPIVEGHVLLCPKRCLKYYEELTPEEKQAVEALRQSVKLALSKSHSAVGFNYAWNEEKIGGQSVDHFHLHIIPRKPGDTGVYNYEPRQFLYRSSNVNDRTQFTARSLEEVVQTIKSCIE